MRSFKRKSDNRRQVFLALSSQIESQLRDAYAKRHEQGETQTSVARRLGVDRSTVNKRLTGQRNMTIETIADMVWALGHCIKINIFDPSENNTNHHIIVPQHSAVVSFAQDNVDCVGAIKLTPSNSPAAVTHTKIEMVGNI